MTNNHKKTKGKNKGIQNKVSDNLTNIYQRLSTGKRINTAVDDSAGLVISQNMQAMSKQVLRPQQPTLRALALISLLRLTKVWNTWTNLKFRTRAGFASSARKHTRTSKPMSPVIPSTEKQISTTTSSITTTSLLSKFRRLVSQQVAS